MKTQGYLDFPQLSGGAVLAGSALEYKRPCFNNAENPPI
jgi:hypothetical protein